MSDPPPVSAESATPTAPAPGEAAASPVMFADWKFLVSGEIHDSALSILENAGAVRKSYLTPDVTHCLVGVDADLDGEVSEAADIYEVLVLSQEFVLDAHRAGRWPPTGPYNPLSAAKRLLGACCACLSGLGPEDSRTLWALIRAHGGQVRRELNARVTHLIARDGLGAKFAAAQRRGIPVVTPDWVLDGIRAGQLRDPAVYHPRLLLLPGQVPPPVKKLRKKRVPPVSTAPVATTPLPTMSTATPTPRPAVTTAPMSLPQDTVPVPTQVAVESSNKPHEAPKPAAQPPPHSSPVSTGPSSAASTAGPVFTTPAPTPPPTREMMPTSTAPPVSMSITAPAPVSAPPATVATPAPPPPNPSPSPTTATTSMASQPPPPVSTAPPSVVSTSVPEPQNVPPDAMSSANTMHGPPPGALQSQPHMVHSHPTSVPTSVEGGQVPPQPHTMGPHTPISTTGPPTLMSQGGPTPQSLPQGIPTPRMNQSQWPPQTTQQSGHWNQAHPQFRPPAGPQPPGMAQPQPQPGWNNGPPEGAPQQVIIRHPHRSHQQQIIQRHIASLTPEQRNSFTQMNPREKQHYLAQRGLLLSNPQMQQQQQQQQMMQKTITLTDQQREMLQTMDPPQRNLFLQKIQRDQQIRQQQILQQRQQQQQQHQMVPQSQGGMPPQGPPQVMVQPGGPQAPLQWQQQGQGFPPGQGGPMPGQQVIRVPHSSPNTSSIMTPGAGPNNRMPVPQSVAGQPRPTWSGETHPALAQVPRTPQQLQHLQRLQMQREQQQQMDQTGAMISGPPGPRPTMGPQAIMGQPQVQMGGVPISQQQQQQAQYLQQQAAMQNGSNQKTKVALANMINNRLGQPPTSGGMPMGSPQGMPTQQPMPNQAPNSMGGPPMSGPMGPDGSAAARLQMMNQQLHPHQGGPHPHMIQQGAMYRPPGAPPQGPRFMAMQQQQQQQRMEMAGHPVGHVMGPGVPPRFPGARMGMPPQPQQQQPQPPQQQPQQRPMAPGQPQGPRIQFHGHDPNTRLPPDLCLLGCIFYIIDYTEDPDMAKYVPDWKKVIKQFGGEVEDEYHPRLTHILCMNQDNPIIPQAIREGKRLVTTYWLNDTVVRKKVGPPWKAIHFPLPPNFVPPCENMIITLTGFVDRNRDWVKDLIAMTGAKYTSYFSRHNHVIICQSAVGDKYNKSKEWNVPAVSVQWLNDVLFGNGNAEQCMQNPKYHNFKMEDPFRMDYTLVPHLIAAWKNPIRVTPETYNKFKANPPARIKRKAERQRLEKEEAKRLREAEEMRGGMPLNQGYPGQMMPNGMGGQQHQNPMMMQQQQQQQHAMGGVPSQMDPNGFNRDQNQSGPGQQGMNPGNPQTGEPTKTGDDLKPNTLTEDKHQQPPIKTESNEKSENKENDVSNKFKVALTGFGPTENEELKALIRELGGQVIMSQHAHLASHLVMHHLGRSVTFFCALPHVDWILSAKWIRDSKKDGKFLAETPYKLKDESFEKQFNFSLEKVLNSSIRKTLLEGKVFYLTPSIKPAMQKVQWIIEASGGVVENRRRRDIAQIKEANPPDQDPSYIIICCEHDLHLVADVLKAKLWIFNVELVLSSIMRQQLDFDPSKYLTTTPATSS